MSKRAVLYARVSGDDRKNVTSSIEGQLELCRQYVAEKGYRVVGEYCEERDKHTSGADWLPELEKLIKLSKQGAFDVLVVREIDRLARNRFKQLSIETSLKRVGVAVEYVKQQFEDTPEGRLLKGLMSEFAEYEREKIRNRIMDGIGRSVRAGNVKVGGSYAPYGYDVALVGERRTLAINELEAAVIRVIFDLYVNRRFTIHAVLTWLDEHNIPKPAKGNNHKARTYKANERGWSLGTLNNILDNETYVGRWYYGKTKVVRDARTGKERRVARPKSEWILVQVPAILNEAIFQAAQKIRKDNKRMMGKQRRRVYALGGMITCGHCGNGMSGITHEPYPYYICNARHNSRRYKIKCNNANYSVSKTDATVWQWVKAILLDPERLNLALENYQQQKRAGLRPFFDMKKANDAELATLQEENENLVAACARGIFTLDEIATKKASLNKRIADLQTANRQLETELEPKLLSQQEIETIETYAAKVRAGAEVAGDEPEIQREIYRLLDMRVTLSSVDSRKWADVTCILGEHHLPAEYNIQPYIGRCE